LAEEEGFLAVVFTRIYRGTIDNRKLLSSLAVSLDVDSRYKQVKYLQARTSDFMGAVNQQSARREVSVRRGLVDAHRYQGIVDRFKMNTSTM